MEEIKKTKVKRKSVRWSAKDITKIKQFIKEAGNEFKGMKAAAEHFKVSYNAVYLRMYKMKQDTFTKHLKKAKTTKIPVTRKKRKYVFKDKKVGIIKKAVQASKPTRSIILDIENIDIDLAKGKLTINY